MKNFLFALLTHLMVACACARGGESGPIVSGRPFSFWLRTWVEKSSSANQRAEAQRAFKQAGTNTIPYLLNELTAAGEVEKRGTASVEDVRQAELRSVAAEAALRFMGSAVTSAIPQLTKLLASTDYGTVRSAAEILSGLGPQGIHSLVSGLTNASTTDSRTAIAAVLRNMGTNIVADVAAIFNSLEGLPKSAAFDCCFALTRSGASVTTLVAEFARRLTSKNPDTRYVCAMTLGELGAQASEALPHLRRLQADPVKNVRDAADWALAHIETKR